MSGFQAQTRITGERIKQEKVERSSGSGLASSCLTYQHSPKVVWSHHEWQMFLVKKHFKKGIADEKCSLLLHQFGPVVFRHAVARRTEETDGSSL